MFLHLKRILLIIIHKQELCRIILQLNESAYRHVDLEQRSSRTHQLGRIDMSTCRSWTQSFNVMKWMTNNLMMKSRIWIVVKTNSFLSYRMSMKSTLSNASIGCSNPYIAGKSFQQLILHPSYRARSIDRDISTSNSQFRLPGL